MKPLVRWLAVGLLGLASSAGCGAPLIDGTYVGPVQGTSTGGTYAVSTGKGTGTSTSGGTSAGTGGTGVGGVGVSNAAAPFCTTYGASVIIGASTSQLAAPYSLALNTSGLPSLAWTTAGQAFYSQWNGSWSGLGGSQVSGIASATGAPGLSVDGNNWPYVAWAQQSGTSASIQFYGYVGDVWRSITSIPFTNLSAAPAVNLVRAPNGVAAMLYQSTFTNAPAALNYLQYNPSNPNRPLDNSDADNNSVLSTAAAMDSQGQFVIAWTNGGANVGTLEPSGNITAYGSQTVSPTGTTVNEPVALALLSNGAPVVAWVDSAAALIYVEEWNGSAWQGLGSTAPAAVNAAAGHHPAIATDDNGNVFVAWEDAASQQIFLRAYSSSAGWHGLPTQGSATTASGTGISNASSQVQWPQLRMGVGNNLVVAWTQSSVATVCGIVP